MKSKTNTIEGADVPEGIPGLAKKTDVFRVPDGYFDHLPGRISDLVHEKKRRGLHSKPANESVLVKRLLIPLLTVSVIVVAFLIFRPENQTGDSNLGNLHDTLNLNAAFDASYAEDALTADYRLTEEILDETAQSAEFDPENDIYLDDQVDDTAIIEYLAEQELDGSLLAEL